MVYLIVLVADANSILELPDRGLVKPLVECKGLFRLNLIFEPISWMEGVEMIANKLFFLFCFYSSSITFELADQIYCGDTLNNSGRPDRTIHDQITSHHITLYCIGAYHIR